MRIIVRHTVFEWIANAYLDFVVLSPILYIKCMVCQTIPFILFDKIHIYAKV